MSQFGTKTRRLDTEPGARGSKELFAESRPGLLEEFRRLGETERKRRFPTSAEIAAELGRNPRTIRHWCDDGRLDFVRVGGRLHVDKRSLEHRLAEAGED